MDITFAKDLHRHYDYILNRITKNFQQMGRSQWSATGAINNSPTRKNI